MKTKMLPDSLCTKLFTIEQEHRRIAAFADKVLEEMGRCDGSEAITGLLNRFEILCKLHFLKEEAIMKETGYTFLDDHKRLHELLLINLDKFKQCGDVSAQETVLLFRNIREDIVTHLLNEGVLLNDFIRLNGCVR